MSLATLHQVRSDKHLHSTELTLGHEIAPSDFFTVGVKIVDQIDQRSNLTVSYSLSLDANCKEHTLGGWIATRLLTKNHLTVVTEQFAPDQTTGTKSETTVTVPPGAPVVLDFPASNSLEQMKSHLGPSLKESVRVALTSIELPLVSAEIKPTQFFAFDPNTGKQELYVGAAAHFTGQDLDLTTATGFSSASSYALVQNPTTNLWTVPVSFWRTLDIEPLSHADQAFSPGHLFPVTQKPKSLIINSKNQLNLTDISTYWTVVEGPGAGAQAFQLTLSARPTYHYNLSLKAPFAKNPESRFLRSSARVQLNVPEVQAMAKEVRLRIGNNSSPQATALMTRTVINSHFAYDDARLEANGKLEDLTTSELVKISRGTCQNFSNLFAAVGRSLGLPVRIVMGYFIVFNGAIGHVWIEFLDTDGGWKPLDPQADYLETFDPSRYLAIVIEEDDEYERSLEKIHAITFDLNVATTQPNTH